MRPEVCEVVTAQRCEPGLGDRGWARVAVAAAAAGLGGGGRSADADSFLSPPPRQRRQRAVLRPCRHIGFYSPVFFPRRYFFGDLILWRDGKV